MRASTLPAVVLASLVMAGCNADEAQAAVNAAAPAQRMAERATTRAGTDRKQNDDAQRLQQIVDDYFEQYLALHPLRATELGDHRFDDRFGDYASPSWMADSLGIEQESLEKLAAVDPRKLGREQYVAYDAFKRQRELNIGGYRYPSELLALDPFASPAEEFVLLGSGRGSHPFRNTRDYDNFLARMDGFTAWVDQAINNLRAGVTKGVVLPKPIVERLLPQLDAVGRLENPRETPFWQPLLNFPAAPSVAERRRLLDAYDRKLREHVLPAYRRLHDYLAKEYLPVARSSVGWSALPGGDFWYAYLVRYYTGSTTTPREAHELGTAEVARLQGEIERLQGALGLTGSIAEAGGALRANPEFRPASPQQLLAAYGRAQARVAPRLPGLFARPLTTRLEIRALEPHRAVVCARSGLSRTAVSRTSVRACCTWTCATSRRGRPISRPRSTWSKACLDVITRRRLPRRLRPCRACSDSDSSNRSTTAGPRMPQRSAVNLECTTKTCSVSSGHSRWNCRERRSIVVDTGLHLHDWTRERAIEYLRSQTALSPADIESAVDRCIAEPAVALAGPIGARRIAALRRKAAQQLGTRFDVRQFHEQVVGGGAMPMPTLELKINRWIATQK